MHGDPKTAEENRIYFPIQLQSTLHIALAIAKEIRTNISRRKGFGEQNNYGSPKIRYVYYPDSLAPIFLFATKDVSILSVRIYLQLKRGYTDKFFITHAEVRYYDYIKQEDTRAIWGSDILAQIREIHPWNTPQIYGKEPWQNKKRQTEEKDKTACDVIQILLGVRGSLTWIDRAKASPSNVQGMHGSYATISYNAGIAGDRERAIAEAEAIIEGHRYEERDE